MLVLTRAGQLVLQSQTKALENWVHRPVYGASALDFSSQAIPSKCSKLDTAVLTSIMEKSDRIDDSKKPRLLNASPTRGPDSLLLDESTPLALNGGTT
jgi:hypothetical protein